MNMREYQYKILVVGDLGTGKTSILKRYVYNTFSSNYKSTIGVDFALKMVQIENDIIVKLQLWDIAGQERFGNITRIYYKGAIGAFIVYDVTRIKTFENVLKWKEDIDSKTQLPVELGGGPIPIILLGNKIDQQKTNNKNQQEEMDKFCIENGFLKWFETSAKEGKNVDEATKHLVDSIVQLEMSKKEEYNVDYNDRIILDNSTINKNHSTCCS